MFVVENNFPDFLHLRVAVGQEVEPARWFEPWLPQSASQTSLGGILNPDFSPLMHLDRKHLKYGECV